MMKRIFLYLLVAVVVLGGFLMLRNASHISGHRIVIREDELAALKGGINPFSIMPLRSVPGNYLAARFAVANDDLHSANMFYGRALASARNREVEELLLDRTLPAAIGSGDIGNALKIARKMDASTPSATAQLGVLLQVVDGFKKNDPKETARMLGLLRDDGFGRLLKPLLEAWGDAGDDHYDRAIAGLQKLAKDYPSLRPLTQMHLAFMHDLQGNEDKAEHYYRLAQAEHLSVRSAYLIGQFYEHKKDKDSAVKLYRQLDGQVAGSPLPQIVINRLENGDLNNKPFVQNASDGVAAALYDVATVLYQENSARLAILYAQMAHYLAPEDEFTILLLGDILASTTVSSQAEEYFTSIERDSDLYALAQMRLAQLYEQQDQDDKAVKILARLEKDSLMEKQALMALADFYRRKEDFAQAIPYYTKLLAKTPKLSENDWMIFYARGICYERDNQWDKAEKDLLQALKLSPQQPEVLNYLAYSWADHGKNLPKSLEMLQKAMAGAPGDPYIADSVGWALYKIGHSTEALPYLEAAIQELPDDPILNSHLGDIYWAVGREFEAQFQWERALKNTKDTDPKAKAELQQRLEEGLPDRPVKKDTSILSGK